MIEVNVKEEVKTVEELDFPVLIRSNHHRLYYLRLNMKELA